MRVTVIGAGHVGLVTAACLAHVGHDVVVDDDDVSKLDLIREGRSWFFEPGLQELLGEVVRAGRLRIAGDKAEAVGHGTVIFICVGTPSRGDGSPNLAFVEAVARDVARHLPEGEFRLVCEKSTVPVQTGERVAQVIAREARPGADWEVASNPEFLREGSAVVDTLDPDRVVVGTTSERGLDALRELYTPILERSGAPFLATDRATAELIKHASNAFLATKISFINSVARVCERSGADVDLVARGMGLDPRIGVHFLKAGAGYGGSCFPKDVAAFAHRSRELGVDFGILNEVAKINHEARRAVVDKVRDALWHLDGKRIGMLGLSFKPNTDDLREAPSLELAEALEKRGARAVGYDPVAGKKAAGLAPNLKIVFDPYEALRGAHAAVVVTEWEELRTLDLDRAASLMEPPKLLVDGRNALDSQAVHDAGLLYRGFGRS
jgi:UDPglucose 6-dehydrogenase